MKKTFYIVIVAAVAYVIAFSIGLTSVRYVAGQWLVNEDGNTFLMTLSQSGKDISGSLKPLNHGGEEVAIGGGISGVAIKFAPGTAGANGAPAAREYEGQVLEVAGILKMKGTVLLPEGGSAAWCATPLFSYMVKDLEEWSDCELSPKSP